MFQPNIISTPAPHHFQSTTFHTSPNMSQTISPQTSTTYDICGPFIFSAKHNGLYLYLGRILRPLWNRRCIDRVCVDGKTITVSYFYLSQGFLELKLLFVLRKLDLWSNFVCYFILVYLRNVNICSSAFSFKIKLTIDNVYHFCRIIGYMAYLFTHCCLSHLQVLLMSFSFSEHLSVAAHFAFLVLALLSWACGGFLHLCSPFLFVFIYSPRILTRFASFIQISFPKIVNMPVLKTLTL